MSDLALWGPMGWWEIGIAANAVISLIWLCIGLLILGPIARSGQLWSNKLATATGLIFLSTAVGRAMFAIIALWLPPEGSSGSQAHPTTWWLVAWNCVIAAIGIYYLTFRRLYGTFLTGAPLFDDVAERERVAALEALVTANELQGRTAAERDVNALMLREVIDNSQAAIYVKDLDGRYLMANPGLAEIMGRPEAEFLGQTDAIIDAELAPLWQESDRKAQLGLYRLEEFNDAFPDGRHFYDSVKFPLHDGTGAVYATCGISLDVTEARIASQAATKARDIAVAATAAKSTFLATMSHEIRTPMNAVIAMTDLLLDTHLDQQQREFAATAQSSGHALLTVINDILDFSKIESGELVLESEAFDLLDTVEGCMEMVAAAASAKTLDLVCHVEPDCPAEVIGDAARLRQILVNLLSNGVKFTARGEVLVTVATKATAGGLLEVTIGVTDTGIGIPADALDRLFRSFSQVDASTTRLYGGTGLGLVITQRLAQAMGGGVEVRSTPGVGSVFTVTVLLRAVPDAKPVLDLAVPEMSVLSGRSVLLVDDNATNLRVLELQLTALGMTCSSVRTPNEALKLIDAGSTFDLAVLDKDMPLMGGVDLGRALRQASHDDSPIILLTSTGWRPAGQDQTFAAFVSKPVKILVLRDALIAVLTGRPVHTVLEQQHLHPSADQTLPLRILLAEDNLVNQRVAQLMLDKLGQGVDIVADGSQALDAVRSAQYDVVLMDIQMPTMDGLEATRQIRAQLSASEQPRIVAMTASVLVEDRAACAAAGMDGYLTKPVRAPELQKLLASVSATLSHGDERGGDDPVVSRPEALESRPPIDAAVLDELLNQVGDEGDDVRDELVGQFLAEGAAQVASLVIAALANDATSVAGLAHTLRSSSGLLGATVLAELLQRTERAARAEDSDLAVLAEPVQLEFARVADAFRVLISNAARTP